LKNLKFSNGLKDEKTQNSSKCLHTQSLGKIEFVLLITISGNYVKNGKFASENPEHVSKRPAVKKNIVLSTFKETFENSIDTKELKSKPNKLRQKL